MIAVTLLAASPTRLPASESSLTVDEIVDRYIQAIGGRERLDAIKTIRLTGKRLGEGVEVPMVTEFKAPNKLRTDITFQGIARTQALDGRVGWLALFSETQRDPIQMPPELVELMKEQADLPSPLVNYREKGHQVELAGNEEIDGIEAYKLRVTRKSGNVEYYYLNAERFLPVRITGKREFRGRETEFVLIPGDFREVDGILMPHRIEQKGTDFGAGTITVFESIEINVDIPDERFELPQSAPDAPAEKQPPDQDE